MKLGRNAPVRMVWNAVSTLDASSAEVSILFPKGGSSASPVPNDQRQNDASGKTAKKRASSQGQAVLLRKEFCLLGRDGAQVPQIALVADEHDDNLGIGVVAEFLEPAEDVDVGRVLRNVVHEEGADCSAVVAVALRSQRT